MPVTVLASFSLLALVVTARPLVTNPNDSRGFDAPGDVQNTVQSVFQSRVGQPANEQIRVHATSAEDQRAVLAELDALGAVKALVPPEDVQTEDEKKLFELVSGSNAEATPSLNDLDGGFAATTEGSEPKELADWWSLATTFYETEPGRLVTLAFACAAATLAVVVVAGLIYAKHLMTTGIRSLHVAYDVLPQVEKRTLPLANDSVLTEKPQPLLIDVPMPLPEAEGNVSEKVDLLDDYDSSSDSDDYDDRDEKFHDAESGQPHIVVDSCPDPDFLPLPLPVARSPTPYSTPPPSPPRTLRRLPSQLQMREANLSASKPAWSLRAADAPALGLARSPSPSPAMRAASPVLVSRPSPSPLDLPSLPGSFGSYEEKEVVERPARRRAYRAPVPELDIAFALQMRPGLGLGSDPAWLVRFLMAMFGWMTVLIGGNGVRRQERWAITA